MRGVTARGAICSTRMDCRLRLFEPMIGKELRADTELRLFPDFFLVDLTVTGLKPPHGASSRDPLATLLMSAAFLPLAALRAKRYRPLANLADIPQIEPAPQLP